MLKKIISTTAEDEYATSEEAATSESTAYEAAAPAVPDASAYQSYSDTSYSSAPAQMSKNILSSDVQIKGSLAFGEELLLDGIVEGEVNSESGHLTVGENARIKGEVKTRAVIVYGKIDGNITVTERCELKADAEIVGDIRAGTLSIEEGAAFMGQSSVGSAAVAKAKSGSGSSASSSSSSSSSSGSKSS